MKVASVRVRRHAWPEAFEFLVSLGVEFSTGVAVVPDDTSEGGGSVEVLLPAAVAPLLDRFPRVRDDVPLELERALGRMWRALARVRDDPAGG